MSRRHGCWTNVVASSSPLARSDDVRSAGRRRHRRRYRDAPWPNCYVGSPVSLTLWAAATLDRLPCRRPQPRRCRSRSFSTREMHRKVGSRGQAAGQGDTRQRHPREIDRGSGRTTTAPRGSYRAAVDGDRLRACGQGGGRDGEEARRATESSLNWAPSFGAERTEIPHQLPRSANAGPRLMLEGCDSTRPPRRCAR